ncbi:hypothetical protein V5799_032038 [Amblyomma americanum]|uniref:Uncharacterized protein n=1 Tax=Amblyomma americanum TaxID=6943 RepID=A0AAQ4DSB2_AMBAM
MYGQCPASVGGNRHAEGNTGQLPDSETLRQRARDKAPGHPATCSALRRERAIPGKDEVGVRYCERFSRSLGVFSLKKSLKKSQNIFSGACQQAIKVYEKLSQDLSIEDICYRGEIYPSLADMLEWITCIEQQFSSQYPWATFFCSAVL